ncbi:MAG: DNA mismatch repair protein MutS [Saprospiraceae bacterium]|nr:DNA mismatch repair protein MutS [Saprospiraceae bacterium]
MEQNLLFEVKSITPLMEQYYAMKAQHPDALLLYRVGDFYETFGSDAEKAANILGIVLTKRNNGGADIELAGFPYHALDSYLPKLVRAGLRVAICEQLEKPVKGKKVVKRGITDVITPGVTLDNKLLDHKKNNFLAAVFQADLVTFGISFADVSTGEFFLAQGTKEYIDKLIQNFSPAEVLIPRSSKVWWEEHFENSLYIYPLEDWIFTSEYACKKLLNHFNTQSLKGFGVDEYEIGQIAAGAILNYLESTQSIVPKHLSNISRIKDDDYVWMDRFTLRNLELVDSMHVDGKSLLDILDHCLTPMGSRLIRKWISLPLQLIDRIEERLVSVEKFLIHDDASSELRKILKTLGDVERLVAKIPMRRINPRELRFIATGLQSIGEIKNYLQQLQPEGLVSKIVQRLDPMDPLISLIRKILQSDAPATINKGGIIKEGNNQELDDLRYIHQNSKDLLLDIQKQEIVNTGISNLKIGFNSVFGYFLEVTNKYKNQGMVPEHWVRKQTMSTGERYVTDELKKLESKILGAEERIIALEEELYNRLVDEIQEFVIPLQNNALAIAQLDCLLSLAFAAKIYHYTKPEVSDHRVIDIKEGRHPVIERQMKEGEFYIPNDVYLDHSDQQIIIITGPNMSGKSAILRQTALICIMAQIGSFVPAKSASIGYLDRIFTRVGASDNISSGESTFMVEMNETASILNNLSDRSLILLDEIGRGTSTYDGISIAWSIAEFLHQSAFKPKTLFATHYHELNELESHYAGIRNFHISTQEIQKKVIFLRKLIEGGSEHSFGIHVAKMAGMPESVVLRAEEILLSLESKRTKGENSIPKVKMHDITIIDPVQNKWKMVIEELKQMDLQSLSPLECMIKINELKKNL